MFNKIAARSKDISPITFFKRAPCTLDRRQLWPTCRSFVRILMLETQGVPPASLKKLGSSCDRLISLMVGQ
uniref:Uncharacterized protein n=1 Tax=Raphanus sativus TaxID=3726 RepID=A0A650GAG8_RAPSA|nr:hypothetical protein [Raphanus sativus]QGW48679.1 hypothetical protein [Raphanus sativus]